MNYDGFFAQTLEKLHDEGNYRVFADLERHRGYFPTATYHGDHKRDVTIWCSNDYLGMGQHPDVIAAMHTALDKVGAGPVEPAISLARPTIMFFSKQNWPTCMAKKQPCCSPAVTCPTGQPSERLPARYPIASFVGCTQSREHDRRHPLFQSRTADMASQ